MKELKLCKYCGNPASQNHHKFPQTKRNTKTYGKKLIDIEWNLEPVCPNCHSSHNKIPADDIWDEHLFRLMLIAKGGILREDLPTPTKSYKRR